MTIKDYLFEIFEEKLPLHYKTDVIRTSQVQMAFDIASFLLTDNSKNIMFIEAPVGTGKSLGALLPTLLVNQKNNFKPFKNDKVVYATATINLQEQLKSSEVPLLLEQHIVKNPILAMGKSHYICNKKYH